MYKSLTCVCVKPLSQSQFADVSDADLKQMDCRISELNSQVEVVMQSCKQLDTGTRPLFIAFMLHR